MPTRSAKRPNVTFQTSAERFGFPISSKVAMTSASRGKSQSSRLFLEAEDNAVEMISVVVAGNHVGIEYITNHTNKQRLANIGERYHKRGLLFVSLSTQYGRHKLQMITPDFCQPLNERCLAFSSRTKIRLLRTYR